MLCYLVNHQALVHIHLTSLCYHIETFGNWNKIKFVSGNVLLIALDTQYFSLLISDGTPRYNLFNMTASQRDLNLMITFLKILNLQFRWTGTFLSSHRMKML